MKKLIMKMLDGIAEWIMSLVGLGRNFGRFDDWF
jgi:hypothetical protein